MGSDAYSPSDANAHYAAARALNDEMVDRLVARLPFTAQNALGLNVPGRKRPPVHAVYRLRQTLNDDAGGGI